MINKKQVDKQHYSSEYDTLERFVSYYNQKELILKTIDRLGKTRNNVKILEIGVGGGFLKSYLSNLGIDIKSFDIADDLKPDYVGNILDIESFPNETFDIVCCFEVLEHIEYKDVAKALFNLSKLSSNVLISVPQVRLYLSLWLKLPKINGIPFGLSTAFPINHKFDGEHYWELGKNGYSRNSFRQLLKKIYLIRSEYVHVLDPYHYFCTLEAKTDHIA